MDRLLDGLPHLAIARNKRIVRIRAPFIARCEHLAIGARDRNDDRWEHLREDHKTARRAAHHALYAVMLGLSTTASTVLR